MVESFIATAQALSLAALIYGAYFVLMRGPQLARAPGRSAQLAKNAGLRAAEITGERERG